MRIEEICEGNFIKKVNITIAAAGTGGHINPGIAIADNLQMDGYNISWLGTPKGMENKLIDKNKFQFFSYKKRCYQIKCYFNTNSPGLRD